MLPKLSTANSKLPQEVTGQAADWAIDDDSLKQLAAEVLEAMKSPTETWGSPAPRLQLFATSTPRNSSPRDWSVDPVVRRFAQFYGTEFLEKIGLGLTSMGADAWPAKVARGARPTVLFQLRHILLHLFLKRLDNLSSF